MKHWSKKLAVTERRQVYEDLYLRAIVESYQCLDQTGASENEIRNRFYWHLRKQNVTTKNLIDTGVLQITFEHWEMVSEEENSRVDLTFFMSGVFRFDVECKRLFKQKYLNKPYVDDGLARFIDLKYATDTDHAAMMGFLITGDANSVSISLQATISVSNPCAPPRPIVRPIRSDWNHSFISYHLRCDGRDIQVYHLILPFQAGE